MATIFSNSTFDINNFDFYQVTQNKYAYNIYSNVNIGGIVYPNIVEVDWQYNGSYYASLFAGSGIQVDANYNIIAGTCTGYLLDEWNGSAWVPSWGITGFSYSAPALYQAFLTPSTADDYAIIKSVLSGNDVISTSPGNDIFNGFGGINTALYSGLRSQYQLTWLSNGALQVTDLRSGSPDGTDQLFNIQFLQFADLTLAVKPPTVTVQNDPTAARGQPLALSTLVTIVDPDNGGYQTLELWDSKGTVGGGQFVVNGVPQTGGHEIDVSPANVANTVFNVGTLGGTDTLWARLLEANGTLTAWQPFTVTAPAATVLPTVAVTSNPNAMLGQTLALSTLAAISDPQSVGYQKLELWDSKGTVAGGQFVVNGVAQTGGHEIDVLPADVANTVFDAGTSAGTDTLMARVLEANGTLTAWKPFTVTVPTPTVAVHNYTTATPGQTIDLPNLVTISDPGGVSYQKLELWDSNGTPATGQFVVNGVAQTGDHEIDVSPGNVANTVFNEGTAGNTDTLWARLLQNDGTLTPWQQFSVVDPVTIADGATVELTSAYAGRAIFAGPTGTLQLDNSTSFTGTVAGMADQDTLDLRDINFATATKATYSGDGSQGTLSITDGAHTAKIALLLNYMASSFVTSSDGHGGTSIQVQPEPVVMLTQPQHA
jgi:hypothetical protein